MNVEIWSDTACPWCYIGKRRFETALAGFEHRDEVTVTWRSFELEPDAPAEREGDYDQHVADKYGTSVEQVLATRRSITELAAAEGLDYHFDRIRSGNTLDAHRVVHLAAAHGVQDAMKERLLRAHLCEGELLSDPATLVRLASEVGLHEDEVRDMLAGDRYASDVREDERTAASLGISAVPFFVVDRAFGAAGAQPPEVLRSLLEQAWEARSPLSVVGDGPTCGVDGC